MSARVVTWQSGMPSLGPAVVAIGVFDGVHKGHQELLRAAVKEARRLEAMPVALTFDRDPDQVVTPEAAAPQLLTLADKCAYIAATGIRTVLVVPFTEQIAAMSPEAFLDEVLGACCDVRALHVGRDFRFGAKASGDLDTLYVWGVEHGAEVRGHSLVEVDDVPVTSTRIRALVSHGEVGSAGELLGRPTRVSGRIHRGRGEGRQLGFPTANVVPVPHAALPGDGVYAGRALLDDGSLWPAAISVGVPPMFPEARDYLEAHLIGFEGDLYERDVTLEFIERLRLQRSFDSLAELTAAIEADVARAARIDREGVEATVADSEEMEPSLASFLRWAFGHLLAPSELDCEVMEDGTPIVEDPNALRRAQAEVNQAGGDEDFDGVEDWVELIGPRHLSGFYANAGFSAAIVTQPLQAAGIPFRWDPYPPQAMPAYRPAYGAFDRPFSLLVPAHRLWEAEQAMKPVLEAEPAEAADQGDAVVEESRMPWWTGWLVLGMMLLILLMRGSW